MWAKLESLHGTLRELASRNIPKTAAMPQYDTDGYRHLTDKERDYRITRTELQEILGVSERTTYRRIKDYSLNPVEENGDMKFILGDVLDTISRHGLSWHRQSLNRLLSKREIKYKPCYT